MIYNVNVAVGRHLKYLSGIVYAVARRLLDAKLNILITL